MNDLSIQKPGNQPETKGLEAGGIKGLEVKKKKRKRVGQ